MMNTITLGILLFGFNVYGNENELKFGEYKVTDKETGETITYPYYEGNLLVNYLDEKCYDFKLSNFGVLKREFKDNSCINVETEFELFDYQDKFETDKGIIEWNFKNPIKPNHIRISDINDENDVEIIDLNDDRCIPMVLQTAWMSDDGKDYYYEGYSKYYCTQGILRFSFYTDENCRQFVKVFVDIVYQNPLPRWVPKQGTYGWNDKELLFNCDIIESKDGVNVDGTSNYSNELKFGEAVLTKKDDTSQVNTLGLLETYLMSNGKCYMLRMDNFGLSRVEFKIIDNKCEEIQSIERVNYMGKHEDNEWIVEWNFINPLKPNNIKFTNYDDDDNAEVVDLANPHCIPRYQVTDTLDSNGEYEYQVTGYEQFECFHGRLRYAVYNDNNCKEIEEYTFYSMHPDHNPLAYDDERILIWNCEINIIESKDDQNSLNEEYMGQAKERKDIHNEADMKDQKDDTEQPLIKENTHEKKEEKKDKENEEKNDDRKNTNEKQNNYNDTSGYNKNNAGIIIAVIVGILISVLM